MSTLSLEDAIPPVSVLLPVYNAGPYVRIAVQSILSQSFGDFELLVLDDGSNDRSLSVLRELAATDKRMSIRSRENRGLASTLNELIVWSRGRYLARMDADDICFPQRFERQVEYLDAHPECVGLGARSLLIDSAGMPIMASGNELTHDEIDSFHLSAGESRICHSSAMMRREAVIRVGLYNERYVLIGQDLDLFLRLAEIGKLANLPEILVERREHITSICYTHTVQELHNAAKQIMNAARSRRGMGPIPDTNIPTSNPATKADVHRTWAWWALSAGNLPTARKHAAFAMAREPFRFENLRALACAIRGY